MIVEIKKRSTKGTFASPSIKIVEFIMFNEEPIQKSQFIIWCWYDKYNILINQILICQKEQFKIK